MIFKLKFRSNKIKNRWLLLVKYSCFLELIKLINYLSWIKWFFFIKLVCIFLLCLIIVLWVGVVNV